MEEWCKHCDEYKIQVKYSIDDLLDDLALLEIEVQREREHLFNENSYEMVQHNTGKMWMLDFVKRWIESKMGKMEPMIFKVAKDFDFEKFKREWDEAVNSGEHPVIQVNGFEDVRVKEDGEDGNN